jgi:hypothetical protein
MLRKLILIFAVGFIVFFVTESCWNQEAYAKTSTSKIPLNFEEKTNDDCILSSAPTLPSTNSGVLPKPRIKWSPSNFVRYPIHLALNGIHTVDLTIENIGTDTLFIDSISCGAGWLSVSPASATLPPGGWPLKVELTITGGNEETFLVDSVRIQSNDEAGNADVYVPMHVIVSDVYAIAENALVGNPTYYLGVSNTGNLANTNDTAGFYLHHDPYQPNFLYDGSPILGFVSPDNDSLVGRYIFDHGYLVPATSLAVDTFTNLKTIVVEKEFWPVRIQIPPADQYWPWWKIKEKLYIFYSEEGKPEIGMNNKNEQYIALELLTVLYDEPPPWWVEVIPPDTIPETYLGMALDIDCPSDSGSMNKVGDYDEIRRMTYIQGFGETNENYRMAIVQRDPCYQTWGMHACWPDPNTLNPQIWYTPDSLDMPYAMHILRNDSSVYPFPGGYDDENLYMWMSTPGNILQGDGSPTDYNVVTTGKVIPAQDFPPADTHTVAYALVVSDEENIEKLYACVDMIMCGNVDRDGSVTIADVVYYINYLFRNGPGIWSYMSDANADGASGITDVVYLISYLFKGGPAPQCSSL